MIPRKKCEVRSTLDSFVALLHKTAVTNHCGISEGGLTGLYFGGVIELNVEPIHFRDLISSSQFLIHCFLVALRVDLMD
jgi:hypothetical protein